MCASTIHEKAREIPVAEEADVVVCGGGPAGAGAALAAARTGARTVLLEKTITLGGMATGGMVNRLGPYHDQEKMILGGIPREVLDVLVSRGLAQEPEICEPSVCEPETRTCSPYWLVFDPEGMKRVLDELLQEAGVKILLDTQVVQPILRDDVMRGVIVENKSGRQAILGEQVVDATGDGDVAARAGVPFSRGREGDALMQPATLFFKCLNVDWPRAFTYVREHYKELREIAREEVGNDFVLPGTDNYLHAEETYFNCLHERDVDGTDAEDVSRAAIALRRKMWGNLEVLRNHVPGCENASLSMSASALGVRETRRIEGQYILTIDDVLGARRFDDQVYRYACFVDIHEPGNGESSRHADENLAPGESYGVPYRSLVPRRVDNLLVAGRCLSATHEALASVRMMPSCMAMGQAAGTAAAICAEQQVPPRKVNVDRLRQCLCDQDVIL